MTIKSRIAKLENKRQPRRGSPDPGYSLGLPIIDYRTAIADMIDIPGDPERGIIGVRWIDYKAGNHDTENQDS